MTSTQNAYLEITLNIPADKRAAAAAVYAKYRGPFLATIKHAVSKQLLIRDDDVQVLHGFDTVDAAQAYLNSELFTRDVVGELGPLLAGAPEVRIYRAG